MKEFLLNHLSKIFMVFVILFLVGFTVINYKSAEFWNASAVNIVTILWGAMVTFYIKESLTDQRRRNDCIEHVISEIESFIADDANFEISKSTYLKQSSCGNRIKYLYESSFEDIKEDMKFIQDHYNEIRDLYSNHCQNEEELNKVKVDIDRQRDYIIDKCSKIRIHLYSMH